MNEFPPIQHAIKPVLEKSLADPTGDESCCEALDRDAIGELSSDLLDRMTCEELARIIRASGVAELERWDCEGHLGLYDRTTLVRLAHIARRCCQHHDAP
ncbi:MAG: hypothetical protein O2931_03105 [Planctomycetota bacterium]|nr:hypothetical protein [Planctomycetota bacterium]MDA1177766.1 hypothetical protein [Planctomycetota bacterium]